MPTVNDLLLHLRCRAPHLARRLEPIRSLGLLNGVLAIRVPQDSWCREDLAGNTAEIEQEAAHVFGLPVRMEIDVAPPAPEALPLPVMSSKYWNHVIFVAVEPDAVGAVAVPKPLYLDRWLSEFASSRHPDFAPDLEYEGVLGLRYALPERPVLPETGITSVLPDLLDELAALARQRRSYAQLLMGFHGDAFADCVEYRLYTAKEWGTPHTPGPVLQKYVGRIHYLSASLPPLGLRLAKRVASEEIRLGHRKC